MNPSTGVRERESTGIGESDHLGKRERESTGIGESVHWGKREREREYRNR